MGVHMTLLIQGKARSNRINVPRYAPLSYLPIFSSPNQESKPYAVSEFPGPPRKWHSL